MSTVRYATVGEDDSIQLAPEMREALGVRPGDEVAISAAEGHRRTSAAPGNRDIRDLFGMLKPQVQSVRVEDMDPGSGPIPYRDQVAPDEG